MRRLSHLGQLAVFLLLTIALPLYGCARTSGARKDPPRASEVTASLDDAPPAPATAGRTFVWVGGKREIATYVYDPATATLVEKGPRVFMGVRTVYVAASPDKKYLYASHGETPGRVIAFAIDAATGALTRLNDASTSDSGDATGTSHVAVHPSGKWVMTAHLGSGRVSVLPVAADGKVGPPSDTRILARGAHQIVTDRAGKYAFVPVRDGQFVAQFLVDAVAGKLTPNTPAEVRSQPGAGPRHIAFHPSERFAYVNNESNGTVTAYAHDAATGRLTTIQTVPSVPAGFDETGMGHVMVHPSGKFVYASNRFHNSIAAYAVEPATGQLRLLEVETGGGDIAFPRDFTLDPDGRFMLVGNERGDSLTVLAIDDEGRLTRHGVSIAAPTSPQVVLASRMP